MSRSGPGLVVAVEATHLPDEVRGIGRYVRALLPRILALEPRLQLALFTRHDVEALDAEVSSDSTLRGRAGVLHARELRPSSADLFWYPWNVAYPLLSCGAIVVTMHDVVPVVLPDPRRSRWWKNLRWRRRYAATARRATVIMADSAFTAREVGRVLGFPSRRIRVTPLAADDLPVPPVAGDAAALARLGVTSPFFLAVGAADPRKNLALLYGAMQRVVLSTPPASLVLAGPRRGSDPPAPSAPWVRTLGFVSDSDLAVLYRRATALVMPSIYEGFGLPVLEAMRLGGPVICARASSLPEVAGDAAAWFDPHDEADLAATLARVLSDDGMRARMRAAGLRRAARFSWDETARATLRAFEDALGLRGTSLSGRMRGEEVEDGSSRRLQGRGAR
ncbi:MAG TPA: glycosyltransferase family 1 protein [Thermoanaerobaculia bacterium]|nr:glycosyltransferase family 1 protein [Thermoanaerobaculia bacterium]